MKKLASQLVVVLAATCAFAQISKKPAPPWAVTVNVVDESSQPVARADVEISYYVTPPPGRTEAGESMRGPTDANGVFSATHQDTGSVGLGFRATKLGYYPANRGYELYVPGQFDEKIVAANRNPKASLLLRRIGNPIPMYAKWVDSMPPTKNKGTGYDFGAGDWVAPDGKGTSADIYFTALLEKRSEDDWDYKLVVSFPKPGDGIQPFTVSELEKTSALRSPYEAPGNGYEPQWVKRQSQRPGEPAKHGLDESLSFFFRVRTVLDEKGNVVSALYGKIYGDFMNFRYYLNPTSNDRNVEFDPKRNLMKNLKRSQGVSQP